MEKIKKIKYIYIYVAVNGNRLNPMTGEIERQSCKVKQASNCNYLARLIVIFQFVRLNSCTPRQLGLHVHKTESSGLAVFTARRVCIARICRGKTSVRLSHAGIVSKPL